MEVFKKRGALRKISINVNALRTETVEGIFFGPPCPGFSFMIFAEALNDRRGTRVVTTSMVRTASVTDDGYRFQTLNSEYELIVNERKVDH